MGNFKKVQLIEEVEFKNGLPTSLYVLYLYELSYSDKPTSKFYLPGKTKEEAIEEGRLTAQENKVELEDRTN